MESGDVAIDGSRRAVNALFRALDLSDLATSCRVCGKTRQLAPIARLRACARRALKVASIRLSLALGCCCCAGARRRASFGTSGRSPPSCSPAERRTDRLRRRLHGQAKPPRRHPRRRSDDEIWKWTAQRHELLLGRAALGRSSATAILTPVDVTSQPSPVARCRAYRYRPPVRRRVIAASPVPSDQARSSSDGQWEGGRQRILRVDRSFPSAPPNRLQFGPRWSAFTTWTARGVLRT